MSRLIAAISSTGFNVMALGVLAIANIHMPVWFLAYLYVIFSLGLVANVLRIILFPLHRSGEAGHKMQCIICGAKGEPK